MIEVRVHESFEAFDVAAMERLNRSSRRASPFASPHWLRAFAAHDADLRALGASPLLLAGYEGASLRGYLPLKATTERLGTTLSSLTTLEVERPQAVAAPEDERAVAQAFYRFLLHRAERWDALELVQQDPASALYEGPAEPSARHWLRRLPDRTCNVVPLPFRSLTDYVGTLAKKMRWNLRAQVGGLLSTPGLQVLVARTAASRGLLLDVFLDVEARSWKPRAQATMAAREGTYRAVFSDASSSIETVVAVACLDGLPIAGSVWAHYGRATYHLQTAYAESHEALGPGALMTWLPLTEALERGSLALDLLPDFSHYKARWGAVPTHTERVQLLRLGSLRHLRAAAGDLWRRVRPPAEASSPEVRNPYKVAAGPARGDVAIDLGRLTSLLAQARAAGATELDVAQLRARSFFS